MFHKESQEWKKSHRHCAAEQEEQRAADQKVLRKNCVYDTTSTDLKPLCDGLA